MTLSIGSAGNAYTMSLLEESGRNRTSSPPTKLMIRQKSRVKVKD
jgi:hypothetical protein